MELNNSYSIINNLPVMTTINKILVICDSCVTIVVAMRINIVK